MIFMLIKPHVKNLHIFNNWCDLEAYIHKLDLKAFIVRSGSDLKILSNVFAAKITLLMWAEKS